MDQKEAPHVVVMGSINMDLVVQTPRLPLPGETVTGSSFQIFPGGKGANQAVACARLGARTIMVGRVGCDAFGSQLMASLESNGVDISHVAIEPEAASGVAIITIDDQAENNIIVVPGANGRILDADLSYLDQTLDQASILLLQLEIPLKTVIAAAELAMMRGCTVILDPAPAIPLPAALYRHTDILTPNASEAAQLVGFPVETLSDAERASETLLNKGGRTVIIKMGERGAYSLNRQTGGAFYPALPVAAVDTVAAGDAFNGALAVALMEGRPVAEAMHWAVAAGALAVSKEGAQPAMPTRRELLLQLQSRRRA